MPGIRLWPARIDSTQGLRQSKSFASFGFTHPVTPANLLIFLNEIDELALPWALLDPRLGLAFAALRVQTLACDFNGSK